VIGLGNLQTAPSVPGGGSFSALSPKGSNGGEEGAVGIGRGQGQEPTESRVSNPDKYMAGRLFPTIIRPRQANYASGSISFQAKS
jgi:hypothetical protein